MLLNEQNFDRNLRGRFRYLPERIAGMTVSKTEGPLCIHSGLGSDMFNIICSSGNESQKDIQQVINEYSFKGQPYCWWTGFACDPKGLIDWLKNEGLKASEQEQAMAVSLVKYSWPVAAGSLVIRPVIDERGVEEVSTVMQCILPTLEQEAIASFFALAAPYLLDPESALRFLIGYVRGKPVAISSVFLDAGLAAVYDVIVDPEHRGQGFGTRMTLAAMKEGQERGFDIAALTATESAHFLYEKLGFTVFKSLAVYTAS